MASINWEKMTMPNAGAMQIHLGRNERGKRNHSNKDIDSSKSHLNTYIGCNDYSEAHQTLKRRVVEVDEKYPVPKKGKKGVNERIVAVMLVTYCPQAIYDAGRSEDFFRAAHKVHQNYFGIENVCGSCTNYDEMHNYIDTETDTERMSLAHMHTLVAAYAEWIDKNPKTGEPRERRGINGRAFEKRSRYNELNKAMDEMCRKEFGVPYMTGKSKGRGGSKKSVEALKVQSETRAEMLKFENAKKANDDFVRSLNPTPTKTVKNIIGKSKEIPKTEEEMQRDKEIAAAQAILRREDELAIKEKRVNQREEELAADEEKMCEYLAEREADFKKKETKIRENFQAEIAATEKKFTERISELEVENVSFKERFQHQAKSIANAVAIAARTLLEKTMRGMGLHLTSGYTVDAQIRTAQLHQQTNDYQKGR